MSLKKDKDTLYECSLFGKLMPDKFDKLRERVIAFCGEDYVEMRQHEVIFIPSVTTPLGPARNDDLPLRLRSTYGKRSGLARKNWQVFYLGTPEARAGRTVTVRPVVHVPIFGNMLKYFTSLGYAYEFDVAKEGYCYMFKDNILIQFYKMYKVGRKWEMTTLYNVDGDESWIVEATSIPVPIEEVNSVSSDLKSVQQYLSGIVKLEYIDHLILENKIKYRT